MNSTSLRRSSIPLISLVVGLALVVGAPWFAVGASAVPPRCEDGSPPPCTEPDPDPDPDPTPTPPPIVWTGNVSVTNISGGEFNRYAWGGFVRDGSPRYTTPSGNVTWTNAAQTQGTIGLTSTYLPPNGGATGFWLRELGAEYLCRSATNPGVPPSGRSINVILPEPVTTTGTELAEIAGGFVGPVTPTPAGAEEVRIHTIDLVPQDGALHLVLTGYLEANVPWWPDDINDDFTYVAKLHPYASGTVDPAKVMLVGTDPSYTFRLDNWGSGVENEIGPKIRAAVERLMADEINSRIASRPEVQALAAQGYTVSLRSATVSPAGLRLLPSLCQIQ